MIKKIYICLFLAISFLNGYAQKRTNIDDNWLFHYGNSENVKEDFDFIVSRAVTNMPDFYSWVRNKIRKEQKHELKNGILYLKGGDLTEELIDFPKATLYNLSDFFEDEFFETKKVVHLPLKFKP